MGTGIGIIEGSGDGTSVGKGVGGRVYSTSTNDVETSEFASVVFIDVVWFKRRVAFAIPAEALARVDENLPSEIEETRSDEKVDAKSETVPLYASSRRAPSFDLATAPANRTSSVKQTSTAPLAAAVSSSAATAVIESTSLTCVKKLMLFTRAILIALAIALLNWFAVNPLRRRQYPIRANSNGAMVGCCVGCSDGSGDGSRVGPGVGGLEGCGNGSWLGSAVGAAEGSIVGILDG